MPCEPEEFSYAIFEQRLTAAVVAGDESGLVKLWERVLDGANLSSVEWARAESTWLKQVPVHLRTPERLRQAHRDCVTYAPELAETLHWLLELSLQPTH